MSSDRMKFKAICQLPGDAPTDAPRFLAILDGELVRLQAHDRTCTKLTVHHDVAIVDARSGGSVVPGSAKGQPRTKDSDP
jgi:hypothetical protein